MKSILTRHYGDPNVLKIGKRPLQKLSAKDVRVKNDFFSINPVDCGVRRGDYKLLSGKNAPNVLGADFAGTVQEVGKNVSYVKPGDKVVGMLNPFKGGAYSQMVTCPEKQLVKAPDNVDLDTLAAMPLVSLTVYQALLKNAKLKRGETLVVNGATGGVGHIAVQIGKQLGAKVIAICNPEQFLIAKELGADAVLSYKNEYLDQINDTDVFFDAAAKQSYNTVKPHLSSSGRYITTLPTGHTVLLAPIINLFTAKKHLFVGVKPTGKDLKVLVDWLSSGAFKVLIHQQYIMEDVADAHERMNKNGIIGKLIVATD